MTRKSFTAVVERNTTIDGALATEPYETAWAGEARWFVRILEQSGEGARLRVTPQLSPDGLFWCDEGSPPLVIDRPGLYSLALTNFGHWLRLNTETDGDGSSFKVIIYLALKE